MRVSTQPELKLLQLCTDNCFPYGKCSPVAEARDHQKREVRLRTYDGVER